MFKLFATHQKERQRALEILQQNQDILSVPRELELLLTGLFLRGEEEMDYKLTPEKVQEVGELLGKEFILSMFTPDEIAAIKLEKYLASIPVEQRLAGIPPEQRLAGIPSEQRLANLPIAEIEAYLEQLKKQK